MVLMSAPAAEQRTDSADPIDSASAESVRIIRSGTIWVASATIAAGAGLGPLVASGWRPSVMPGGEQAVWWIGMVIAGLGLASMVWAGCPTLGYSIQEAWVQKRRTIRAGIMLNLAGFVIAGIALLISPVPHLG